MPRSAGRKAPRRPRDGGTARRQHPPAVVLPLPPALAGIDLASRLLYRDALMLIIDKPAGLPVHAGPGGGPHLELLFPSLCFGLPRPPQLAHRLDRDTSGCLVLGRHRRALVRLNRLFAAGLVEKVYWAITEGEPAAAAGVIDAPLQKLVRGSGWRMVVDPAGRPAVSAYRRLAAGDGVSLIEVRPRTGRTHQVRVHLQSLGCPVIGDPVYGSSPALSVAMPAMMLHARAVTVPLYENRPPVAAVAPVPAAMDALLTRHKLADGLAAGEPG
ncbi:MAG: RNA pseudouridine synthase [Rhodospirillales bacterium]|nr:RNA pseudouridine synthase [Rhodospirillales bacterium]